MLKDDYKYMISIISTLIAVIISSCISTSIFQILFIFIFVLICYLIISNLNNYKKWKKILIFASCIFEAFIIIYSISAIGSVGSFLSNIVDFFIRDESNNTELSINDTSVNNLYLDINEQVSQIMTEIGEMNHDIANLDYSIEDLNTNVVKMDENIYEMANNLGNPYIRDIDDNEVDKFLQLIEKYFNEKKDSFSDLQTDPYLIELFYKMYISNEPYYYCNIIKAFNEFGIDTEKYDISENDLFVWDIEILYITYNMKNSILNELESDEIIDKKEFKYNDFRVDMNRYSDTFNYDNWQRTYTECTMKQIDKWLNNIINVYYKKLIMNFSNE